MHSGSEASQAVTDAGLGLRETTIMGLYRGILYWGYIGII